MTLEQTPLDRRMIHAERLAALGELAAGLAHEIHNPLDGMMECINYLEKDPDKSDRATKYYPMIQEGLNRIARVMREMLTLAHSGQNIHIEPCDLAGIFESLTLLVDSLISGKKIRVTWDNPRNYICLCDQQGLTQALLNLVLNASEAAEGTADSQVLIKTECDPQQIHIFVEDSGSGVPEELRDRIFDPFFTTKPAGQGTGLGLSVSREMLRTIGGDIEFLPRSGALIGARFVIRLPRASNEKERDG